MIDSTRIDERWQDLSVVIAWGSSTGYTEEAAVALHRKLGSWVDEVVDIAETPFEHVASHDVLILGAPTWHIGELQDDWDDRLEEIANTDLTGKTVALFGCGDANGYPDNFQDALGILWRELEPRGATLVGLCSVEGYDFLESQGLTPDGQHFLGLAIDEHAQCHLTDERITRWAEQVQQEVAALTAKASAVEAHPPAA
ncbi:MAG: flavodoxin [Acidobacteriota bacterium]